MDGEALVEKLRQDELRSIQNDVSTDLRDQILKALDERGRAQELVRQQYSGRYPFELLQNANDASVERGGGRVLFAVTDTALVVADQGDGFGPDQIRAICGLGRSSKDPRKSIGYKGLGFKSVGEITDLPQIISGSVAFGFDDERTRRAVAEIAGPLLDTQRLPVYAFPFLLRSDNFGPDATLVEELQQRGFRTILRLPLRGDVSSTLVAEQVQQTIVPRLLLFLDATESLELTGTGSDFVAEVAREVKGECTETLLQVGRREEHWLVFRRALTDLDRSLVDPLGDAWQLVQEVHVAVGVPLDDALPTGDTPQPLHVYFPTEERTGLPLLLHGDFALELDRRHVSLSPEMRPYNEWLGKELASLVAHVAGALADRFPDDPAVVRAVTPMGPSSGFGDQLTGEIWAALRRARFVPVISGDARTPVDCVLLPLSLPRPPTAIAFLDLKEHPSTVLPEVQGHLASRRFLAEQLDTPELSTEVTLQLLAEPDPDRDEDFYELLVEWGEREGRSFAASLSHVECVRTLGGGWVKPSSGVFFPRQREEVTFPEGLPVPITAVHDVDGLPPLLEAAGVRPFEWRLLIPDFVLPLLRDPDLDDETRAAGLAALRGYYETERTGDVRMKGLIAQALIPARNAAGTVRSLRPVGSLYFSSSWLGHDRLELIYGPFNDVEFLDVDPPAEATSKAEERAFFEWLGVGAHPRVDARRSEQRDLYPLGNLSRHPHHQAYGQLWWDWLSSSEFRGVLACDQGHTNSQNLRVSFALDRFTRIAATRDPARLGLLWRELSGAWPTYEDAMHAEIQCNHGWHAERPIRQVPSLLAYTLRETEWVPCKKGKQRSFVRPERAWRITSDTPPRIIERVNVLDPSLDTSRSAAMMEALDLVDAARPSPPDLVVLLEEIEAAFNATEEDEDTRPLQLAARWSMRALNDALQSDEAIDGRVPLLARQAGRYVFSEEPFVASDALLAETWEPLFPILDADRDLRRLHEVLRLRDLDEEVDTVPLAHRPRGDLRLGVERLLREAAPFLAAVAIDQVPSRHSDVIRGLSRLEVSVCEELVLRYVLDGQERERDEAVSYIAARVEQEGIRRRIGTAHLELDPRTNLPHWYAFGPQLALFLGVPTLGDAFALLMAADKPQRQQYLAARRVPLSAVDEARLELDQPAEEDEAIRALLRMDDVTIEDWEGTRDRGPGDQPGTGERTPTSDSQAESVAEAVEVSLPELDLDSLTIEDAIPPQAREADDESNRRRRTPGLGPSGPVDHESIQRLQRQIGRRGEEAVYEAERQFLASLGRDRDIVVWRSSEKEFAPYDIESQDPDGQHIYIEVKSTTSDDPWDPFEISDAELTFAMQKRNSYYIYRVTEAHLATPRITRFRDPVGRLHDNTARLRLSGARLVFFRPEEPTYRASLAKPG